MKKTNQDNTINQCQGCQADWPLESKFLHLVPGGYPGERCVCTAGLYPSNQGETHETEVQGRVGMGRTRQES